MHMFPMNLKSKWRENDSGSYTVRIIHMLLLKPHFINFVIFMKFLHFEILFVHCVIDSICVSKINYVVL